MISPTSSRHYGLDWLRIGAFGLLIVYHVAMVFSTWDWVIKSPTTYPQLIVPLALLTPWRLPLLFGVSGYASRKLFDKSGAPGPFVASRNRRLLIPWAVAMVALIPAETWVRAKIAGYPAGLIHYWLRDYWNVTRTYGPPFPSWEHLWFVAYLWAYTMALAGLLAMRRWSAERFTLAGNWLAKGARLVWVPVVALALAKLAVMFVVPEKQGLFTDWNAHFLYFPIFLFGFALGGKGTALWPAIARSQRVAIVLAIVSGLIVTWVELDYAGRHMPPHGVMMLDRVSRIAMAWSMILILFQLADRHLNRDNRWRATLAEAVFPLYIAHHPAIILLAWLTLPWGLDPFAEFVLLLLGTFGFSIGFYAIGREVAWLRPLVGLAPRRSRPAPATAIPASQA
ncbi:MAG: acyltransferase family protein [Sphingomonas sp.]|uniref:acyltransferase family protein n=1 Tax=Sphingomonas sp. TaxID=28214 RepID=UPI001ACF4EC9|nr:acyltransferase family protein [Sphingomonas sp.]MBN8816683.1 acyltransferase family protein [Sphingomonas sp.]